MLRIGPVVGYTDVCGYQFSVMFVDTAIKIFYRFIILIIL